MIIFYINNKNQQQARIIRNLYRSCTEPKHLQATSRFDPNNRLHEKAKLIVFAGYLRGDGLIYRYCRDNNKNFLYVDHAYLNRNYNSSNPKNEWMRLTHNAFTWNRNENESNERWNEHFAQTYSLSPWNQNFGKNILVLPPSEATKFLFPDSVSWMKQTLDDIAKRTTAPIRIREKPLQVVVDPGTNDVIRGYNVKHEQNIEAEMLNAKCIVTFNSAVPVLGTILGIPCYTSPHAAAHPMSIDLNYLNHPPEPARQDWLNQLVYHQFTSHEMQTGKVWKLLTKYQPKRFR